MERIITRSYSISSDSDNQHVLNGRCPNYALTWTLVDNTPHWENGHEYFIGNGLDITDETKEIRSLLSRRITKGHRPDKIIFCDLDGVLADFHVGVINRFKVPPDDMSPKNLWSSINKSKSFFETLPWMPRGKELWSLIREYHPVILTGVPKNNKKIIKQKQEWCRRELGEDVDVITCLSRDKSKYCLPGYILIDDSLKCLIDWREKGGQFIMYDEHKFEENINTIITYMKETI